MSIDNPTVIDAMGIERATGEVVLTISDHLDWDDERSHLEAMQAKLNAYLDFVASGQIREANPDAGDAPVRIDVIAKHSAPPTVGWFLQKASNIAGQSGVGFRYHQLPNGY